MVNIEGLSKAQVLAAAYNAAQPQGMGFFQYVSEPMSVEVAESLLDKTYFDYLHGRVMKLSLKSDKEVDSQLYDRDNGSNALQQIINSLRETGDVNNTFISNMHKRNTQKQYLDPRLGERIKNGI